MVLYSISNAYDNESGGFNREVVIDEFISAIWTERFIEAGEVEIVLPAVHRHLKLLAPGNLLGCGGSQEIMLLETRSIENGLVTAKGKTIESFFNERYIPGRHVVGEITAAGKGGDILKGVVNYMQDWLVGTQNAWGPQIASSKFRIRGLFTDAPNPTEEGELYTETIPPGPVYDTLVTLAKKYRIGQSVIWTKMEDKGHKLVYTTRRGVDRTYPSTMLFSPKLDNLANLKQLLSVAGSKNIVNIVPPEWVIEVPLSDSTGELRSRVGGNPYLWQMSNYTTDRPRIGEDYIFGPRYIEIDCTDLTLEKLGGPTDLGLATQEDYYPALDKLFSIVQRRQKKALIENKSTKMIDGEITPAFKYVYKQDYDLGDIVKVQGEFGDPLWAVISEYIRSQDETGERSYPTISTDVDYINNQGTPDPNPPTDPTIT